MQIKTKLLYFTFMDKTLIQKQKWLINSDFTPHNHFTAFYNENTFSLYRHKNQQCAAFPFPLLMPLRKLHKISTSKVSRHRMTRISVIKVQMLQISNRTFMKFGRKKGSHIWETT